MSARPLNVPPRPSPRRRRRRRLLPALLRLVLLLAIFALGVVLGEAYADRPRPATTSTLEREVRQVTVTETVARRTVTVVVTGPTP